MKINTIKMLLAIALALVLAFVCEIIAPEIGGRNWISLGVCFVSVFSMLLPAMGLSYDNARRAVSLKVFSWISVALLVLTNVAFSSNEYRVDVYIAVSLLLVVIAWIILYGMLSAK